MNVLRLARGARESGAHFARRGCAVHRLTRGRERGVGLPTALFVITIMAAIAAAISRLVAQSAADTGEAVQLVRALYAAESGAGFALHALYPPAGYPDYAAQSCALIEHTFTAPGLAGCSVSASCTQYANHEGVLHFNIISTGTCGKVQRRIQVQSRFEPSP